MNKHLEVLENLKKTIEQALINYSFEYTSSNKIKVYISGKFEGNWEKHYFKTIFLIELRSKKERIAIQLGILLEKLLQEKMGSNLPEIGYV